MTTSQELIQAGNAALKIADWARAKNHFEQALIEMDTPEAHDGLGIALWWLNDIADAHHQRTLAYNGFKARGVAGRAAFIACWLAREQVFLHGNITAMQGWFARAERLIGTIPSSQESAWFAIFRASMMEQPQALEAIAAQTIEKSRTFLDSNLEGFALAFYGLAQVTLGHVSQGMARLDEAMTMATSGEVTDFMTISEIFCVMLSACEASGDLVRSDHWCQVATDFAQRHQCPFLSAYCRTTYGSLLSAMGRWQDAEAALTEAIRAFEMGHKGLRIHAVIKLADLRVHQGRVEEAEIMLDGLADQGDAIVPLARLHLARGETALAKALLEQSLPPDSPITLHQLPSLLLLVEVLLMLDEMDSAYEVAARLMRLAQTANTHQLIAQAELARGRVHLYASAFTEAKDCFNAAMGYLKAYEQSLLAGQVRLQMAQTLLEGDPTGAVVWARAALATFERIGATRDRAEAQSLLRQLGSSSGSGTRLRKSLTRRESEIFTFLALGLTNREIAQRLVISPKTVEHHVGQILDKLNLRNRAEAAAFAASGKLADFYE